ncbi:MAG: hypothetical protein H3C62_16290 [Gemmatimonadaceae bacterium]|nr:hypothetical protein [Gemmatimonadaceae bacterium]
MIRQRLVPLALAAVATIAVACVEGSTSVTGVPFGFVTIAAQRSGAAYITSPVGTFYSTSGLGTPTASSSWDSCRVGTYSSAPASLGDVFPSLDAGAAIEVRLPGRVDSLFPAVVGNDVQYRLRGAGVPYVPGDSVSVVVPGRAGGYPAVSFKAKTAEVLTVVDFGEVPVGPRLDLHWNPGHDANGTVAFAFRYGALAADTLNTQISCQFRDDGTDSIPSKYIASWASAKTKSWVATRVRTHVVPVAGSGFFDFISTFDVPTP